jgi:hypothetical protein
MNRERIVQIFFFGLLALITYGLFLVLEPFLTPINGATVSGTITIQTRVASNVSWAKNYPDGTGNGNVCSPIGGNCSIGFYTTTVSNGHCLTIKAFSTSNAVLATVSAGVNVSN